MEKVRCRAAADLLLCSCERGRSEAEAERELEELPVRLALRGHPGEGLHRSHRRASLASDGGGQGSRLRSEPATAAAAVGPRLTAG